LAIAAGNPTLAASVLMISVERAPAHGEFCTAAHPSMTLRRVFGYHY
jgi:hypothetical protein